MATESCVLLKNENAILPLDKNTIQHIAIIGPMADEGYEQMGTWTFDGKEEWCQTPLQAIRNMAAENIQLHVAKGLTHSRDNTKDGFDEAITAAKQSDVILCFMGEEAILSGEAHCRADIDLPGSQSALLEALAKLGKPIVLVLMTGRPLTIEQNLQYANAVLYAWHPGTMGGPAIADILFGQVSPSGKLPVTFPKMVGQIPIYYNRRKSGRAATVETAKRIDEIPVRAFQTSTGNTCYHLDAGFEPLFPFGYGLSYTNFKYENIQLSKEEIELGDTIQISADLTNTGQYDAVEVAQLYIRDVVGSVTRPVKELKGFQRIALKAGETKTLSFELHTDALAFYNRDGKWCAEPGKFEVWIGGDSNAELGTIFRVIAKDSTKNEIVMQ